MNFDSLNECSENTTSNISACLTDSRKLLPIAAYNVIAVYLFSITFLGVIINGVVIYLYFSRRDLSTNANTYVVALCLCGFLMSIFGVTFAAASTLRHSWIFGSELCQIHGFVLTGLGIAMIALLTGIAIDKYIFIVKYQASHRVTKNVGILIVSFCYLYGVTWGLFPLFGWNHFQLEIAQLSCSITWDSDSMAFNSYSISLLFAGLIIPVGIIIYLYSSILRKIHLQRIVSQRLVSNLRRRGLARRERKIAATVFMMVGAFIISWLPYSIYAVIAILGYADNVSPLWQTIPSMFAKGSILWNPLIYGSRSSSIKKALWETYPCLEKLIPKKRRSDGSMQLNRTTVNSSLGSNSVFAHSYTSGVKIKATAV